MGYTHYFQNIKITDDLLRTAEKIISAAESYGITICGPDGMDKPILTDDMIAFNGSRAKVEDCESFVIKPGQWDFCKTRYLPYDTAVTAVLTHCILTHNGRVSSDGTFCDWKDGVGLYEKAIGRSLTEDEQKRMVQTLGY